MIPVEQEEIILEMVVEMVEMVDLVEVYPQVVMVLVEVVLVDILVMVGKVLLSQVELDRQVLAEEEVVARRRARRPASSD